MRIIVCVDLKNGMMFNKRRQSQDRMVRRDILRMTGEDKLWMNHYSYGQFSNDMGNIFVDEDFLKNAEEDDYCFVENCKLADMQAEQLILYRWNKIYQSDVKLDADMREWHLISQLEIEGYSHDKIAKEVYEKHEK